MSEFPKNATFEEKVQLLYNAMTEKQKQQNREQVKFMCRQYCGKCPSRQGTGEQMLGFCMEGKSAIITQKKACLCAQCPISKMMSFRWDSFCLRGTAMSLSNLAQK